MPGTDHAARRLCLRHAGQDAVQHSKKIIPSPESRQKLKKNYDHGKAFSHFFSSVFSRVTGRGK
jgi:hypothetical protein